MTIQPQTQSTKRYTIWPTWGAHLKGKATEATFGQLKQGERYLIAEFSDLNFQFEKHGKERKLASNQWLPDNWKH